MEIQKYNEDSISTNEETIILDYKKKLNDKFYNIDISFIDEFIELVDKDEFCIYHEMLVIYGASQMSSGSNYIKNLWNNTFLLKTRIIKKHVRRSAELMIILIKLNIV